MVIFESPFLQIQYDENLEAMIEEWKLDFTSNPHGDNMREPLQKLLEEFKNRNLKRWLCDNTEQKALQSADQRWLESYYYPQLIELGLEKAALVNAKEILGTVVAKNCLQNVEEEVLNIEVFNKYHEAYTWLGKNA